MTTQNMAEPLQPGTLVKILNSGFHRSVVAENLGELGPKGARVYRVLAVKKPRMYIEVLEEQLEVLDNDVTPSLKSHEPLPTERLTTVPPLESDVQNRGTLKMTAQNLSEPLKRGTLVKILNSGFHRARILENLGELGPKGARIYRLQIAGKPRMYIEVREDQLELLDDPFAAKYVES